MVKTPLESKTGVPHRLGLPQEGGTHALLLNRAPTVLLFPRMGTTASRDAPAAGGVTAMSVPWGAVAMHRLASAAACLASAARAASSAPRATGASARVAVQVSPASRVLGPTRGGVGQSIGGMCAN